METGKLAAEFTVHTLKEPVRSRRRWASAWMLQALQQSLPLESTCIYCPRWTVQQFSILG